jgi:hypothetical protein
MRSSYLFHKLKTRPVKPTSNSLVKLKEEFELLERQESVFSDDEPASSSPVEQEGKALLSEQEKIAVEESRLKIMKKMLTYLENNGEIEEKGPLQKLVLQTPQKKWAKPAYVFLMLFNVLFMAIGGFLGMQEVLRDAFPTILPFVMNLISGGLAACECAMSYSISSPYVKKGLGLPEDEIARTITMIQEEQCQVTEAINARLLSPQCYQTMNQSDYSKNAELSLVFNDYVSTIKPIEFQEPVFRKKIRLFFIAVSTVLMMTNTFYMTTAFLKAVAVTLVGTPVGWTLIAGVILIQIAAASIMRSESMFEMLNPEVVKIKEANKKITSFKSKREDFQLILTELQEKESLLREKRDSKNNGKGRRYSVPILSTLFKPNNFVADLPGVSVVSHRQRPELPLKIKSSQ